MTTAMVLAVAYLLGSIPTSYIVIHLVTGRDIRTIGNGNPGMMNVWDNVGFKPALVVGLGDIGKGMAAVGFAYWMGLGDVGAILAGLVAVAGHDYSVFLRFHGGNGTAAAVGALIALAPEATMPAILVAIALFVLIRSKRFAGLVAMLLLPIIAYTIGLPLIKIAGIVLLLTAIAVKIVRFEGFTPVRTRPPR